MLSTQNRTDHVAVAQDMFCLAHFHLVFAVKLGKVRGYKMELSLYEILLLTFRVFQHNIDWLLLALRGEKVGECISLKTTLGRLPGGFLTSMQ